MRHWTSKRSGWSRIWLQRPGLAAHSWRRAVLVRAEWLWSSYRAWRGHRPLFGSCRSSWTLNNERSRSTLRGWEGTSYRQLSWSRESLLRRRSLLWIGCSCRRAPLCWEWRNRLHSALGPLTCPRLIRRRSPFGWNGRGLRALRLASESWELLVLPRGYIHSWLLKYRPRLGDPLTCRGLRGAPCWCWPC